MPDDSDVTIRLQILCEHCGEVAVHEMTPEVARKAASGLLAAAAGLPQTATIVTGRDS